MFRKKREVTEWDGNCENIGDFFLICNKFQELFLGNRTYKKFRLTFAYKYFYKFVGFEP